MKHKEIILVVLLLFSTIATINFTENTKAIGEHEESSGNTTGYITLQSLNYTLRYDYSEYRYAESVWANDSGVFFGLHVLSGNYTRAYSFNGISFSSLDNCSGNTRVYGYGGYIYTYTHNLSVYSFNGTSFTFIDSIDNGTYYDVYHDGTYIYCACSSGGIYIYTFDGVSFTYVASIDDGGKATSIWGNGTYIYLANYNDLRVYSFDGVTITCLGYTSITSSKFYSVYGNSTILYAGTTSTTSKETLLAYSFNGTAFTLLDSIGTDDNSVVKNIWVDSHDNIYVAYSSDGLYIFILVDNEFIRVDNIHDGEITDYYIWGIAFDVYGHGDYVYLANCWDGFRAYSRFEKYNVSRTIYSDWESNNISFTPDYNHTENMTLKVPVSDSVKAIMEITNNTCGNIATEVNDTSELVNGTFWYDSANQFVYIKTTNATTSTLVNWTINASHGGNFYINIPQYREVGDYIIMSGAIENTTGVLMDDVIATTHIYYQNGTDAILPLHKHNCTGGNYFCTISTSTLPPGVYDISIEFSDPDTGWTLKYGATLYLSYSPEPGIYSDAILHVRWYNTNFGLGLPEETMQIFIDDEQQFDTDYYTYIGASINVTIKDFYNFTLYTDIITIDKADYPLNLGLTFHEYDFSNSNDEYYIVSFLKSGASRWYEIIIPARGQDETLLPTGNYTIRIYNADNSTYVSWTETINRSKGYMIHGDNITQVIEGLSVITGNILELNSNIDYALTPDVTIISCNPPMVRSCYDKKGMPLGDNIWIIDPIYNIQATTRSETLGNYINSTALIPGNGSVANGTITILKDTMWISGNGSVSWVNITYTDNGTLYQNTTYIPSRIDLYGQNLTINASCDIYVQRETEYNQMKHFGWIVYGDTGEHRYTIDVENPMSTPIYDVYVYVGFSNESTPDENTVVIIDVANGNLELVRGENFKTGGCIEFFILSIAANGTREFAISYYWSNYEQLNYDTAIIYIDDYKTKQSVTFDDRFFNSFTKPYVNDESTTFRGEIIIVLDFDKSNEIETSSIHIWDVKNSRMLNRSLVWPGPGSIMISSDAIGDVSPGGGREFTVYFRFMEYPGADPTEWHLNTMLFPPLPITVYLIIFLLALIPLGCGIYIIMSSKNKKKATKGILLVGIGLFIIVVFFILQAKGI